MNHEQEADFKEIIKYEKYCMIRDDLLSNRAESESHEINKIGMDKVLNKIKDYPVFFTDDVVAEIKGYQNKEIIIIASILLGAICSLLVIFSVPDKNIQVLLIAILILLIIFGIKKTIYGFSSKNLIAPFEIMRINDNVTEAFKFSIDKIYANEINVSEYKKLNFVCKHYPEIKAKCQEIIRQRGCICRLDYSQFFIEGICWILLEKEKEAEFFDVNKFKTDLIKD